MIDASRAVELVVVTCLMDLLAVSGSDELGLETDRSGLYRGRDGSGASPWDGHGVGDCECNSFF